MKYKKKSKQGKDESAHPRIHRPIESFIDATKWDKKATWAEIAGAPMVESDRKRQCDDAPPNVP